MKHIILLFTLFFPVLLPAQSNNEFLAEYKKGYLCINHLAVKGENINDLAQRYFIKSEVIANVNNVSPMAVFKDKQPIMIPLLETNYFRMSGISIGQKGFYPIYYHCADIDSIESICYKFMLQKSVFMKWNHLSNGDQISEGQKVMVGWLKYGTQVAAPNTNTSKPLSTQKPANDTKPVLKVQPTVASKTNQTIQSNNSVVKKETAKEITTTSKTISSNQPKTSEEKPVSLTQKIKQKIQPKEKPATTNKVDSSLIEANKMNDVDYKIAAKKDEEKTIKQASNQPVKKKKSIKEIWSDVVNGKNYQEPAKRTQTTAPLVQKNVVNSQSKPAGQGSTVASKNQAKPVVHDNTQPLPKTTNPTSKPVNVNTQKNNIDNMQKNATAQSKEITPLKGSETKTQNKVENTTSTITTSNATTNSTTSKVEPKKEKKISVVEPKIVAVETKNKVEKSSQLSTEKSQAANTKVVSNVNSNKIETQAKVSSQNTAVISVQKQSSSTGQANESNKPLDEQKEKSSQEISNVKSTVHSEVRSLDLSRNKSGKCAYFFSGPMSGQFYVFTNLALKGDIVKITNVQNNKSVMAEVIGALPNSDVAKGLLIKLSDNAKLPLGQKSNAFNVKVNY